MRSRSKAALDQRFQVVIPALDVSIIFTALKMLERALVFRLGMYAAPRDHKARSRC